MNTPSITAIDGARSSARCITGFKSSLRSTCIGMNRRQLFVAAINFTISAFFAWLFYARYWKWRDCIREAMSSCITPDGANLIGGGAMWALPAAGFAVAAAIYLLRWILSIRHSRVGGNP